MKVLVLGSNGMAGHVITKYLKEQGHEVTTAARDNADIHIDIYDIESINHTLTDNSFDYVINCIGLLVKNCIDSPQAAALINGWFPHYLELEFHNSETKVIHLSTDCVFDGCAAKAYQVNDIHTEMNAYGKSKSLGEINNNKDLTIRTSIIGPEIKENGTGLFRWVCSSNETELSGWENHLWNGMTTLHLAKIIDYCMYSDCYTNILQIGTQPISKYELLCLINEIFNLEKTIVQTNADKPCDKLLVSNVSLFDKMVLPSHRQMLEDLKEWYYK